MSLSVNETPSVQTLVPALQREWDKLPRGDRKAVSDHDRDHLFERVIQDIMGFGPLQSLLDDDSVTEIMVTAADTIYIEKDGRKQIAANRFIDADHMNMVVDRMMMDTGRRLDKSMPYCDFALADGSRVHVIIPPISEHCPQITIRKFLDTIQGIDDLVRFGTLDERMATFLRATIEVRKNLLFSGATGSGKTTTLGAMSTEVSPQERIVVIEDTRELQLKQGHVVYLVTRPPNIEGTGEITLRDLVRNSLRMRPSRILLGELRSGEALDFLQSINSGHRGCSAVLHASGPEHAIYRLETLAQMSGLPIPMAAIRKQIASGLDIIIQQEQMTDGARKITHISEVRGIGEDGVDVQDLFRHEILRTHEDGRVEGRFVAVQPPADLDGYLREGAKLSADLFT